MEANNIDAAISKWQETKFSNQGHLDGHSSFYFLGLGLISCSCLTDRVLIFFSTTLEEMTARGDCEQDTPPCSQSQKRTEA